MVHHTPLLSTIAVGLVAAFAFGYLGQRVKLSPIVGYLVAGMLIGPFTPGFVGDVDLANQLSEIGVILLMFGVGLHFSLRELLAVRRVALPGAILQMTVATGLGTGLGLVLGWSLSGSLLFGLALSCASTVVMLKGLEEHQMLDTRTGHIAVGWLIVEDIAMVLALVIVPVLAVDDISTFELSVSLLITIAKVSVFAAIMLVVGKRVIPWALARVADTGSRELLSLAVLALGLGVAVGAASLFDVSFALGAFFAGMVLRESDLSHRAAEDSLPLRDAFAVLFFLAVGMLVDPRVVLDQPLALAATVAVIIVGKLSIAYVLMRVLKYSRAMSIAVAASLAQIGEFSFILVTLGADLELLSPEAQSLVLAGAMISIASNPLLFTWATRSYRADAESHDPESAPIESDATDHVVVVGYGRVGERVAKGQEQLSIGLREVEIDGLQIELEAIGFRLPTHGRADLIGRQCGRESERIRE
jgi:CPA2 family monovalent cation:H+ antiporter-2